MKNSKVITTIILVIFMLSFSASVIAASYHDYYGQYSDDEWRNYDELFENDDVPARIVVGVPRTFGGCYIAQESGVLLDDIDCDKVADISDNCLGLANPSQLDQNSNGLGDACDLVLESIDYDPEYIVEGRSFITKVRLMNNRAAPVRNIVLKIQIPELGLESSQIIEQLDADTLGEYEFIMRAPNCVSKNTFGLVAIVEFPAMPGIKEFFYIPSQIDFIHSEICTPPHQGYGDTKSLVEIIEMQDIDAIKGGIYPFKIKNSGKESTSYILQTEGFEDWGTVAIEPGSLIVVPAGETREGRLVVKSLPDAKGTKGFLLTIKSKEDFEQVLLNANIKEADLETPSLKLQWVYAIVFIIFILAIISVVEMMNKKKNSK